jgi:hypothetical protein
MVNWIRQKCTCSDAILATGHRGRLGDEAFTGTQINLSSCQVKDIRSHKPQLHQMQKVDKIQDRQAAKLKTLGRDIFRFRNNAASVYCNRTTGLRMQVLIFRFHFRYSRGIPQYRPNIQSEKHNKRPLQKSCTVYPRNRGVVGSVAPRRPERNVSRGEQMRLECSTVHFTARFSVAPGDQRNAAQCISRHASQ